MSVDSRRPCLSATGGGREKEQALCLCPPWAEAPGRTRPGPETAMLLLATATAEWTVLSARLERQLRKHGPSLQSELRLS